MQPGEHARLARLPPPPRQLAHRLLERDGREQRAWFGLGFGLGFGFGFGFGFGLGLGFGLVLGLGSGFG